MRNLLALLIVGFLAFWFAAKETPASLISRLTVWFNGPDYALKIFRDQVPIRQVLASNDRGPGNPHAPTCRVAVVEMEADAPARPRRVPLIDQEGTRFGGNWKPTPLAPGLPLSPDLLALCGDGLDRITRRNLEKALSEPGAFYIRDWKDDILQIYAPKIGIAAHLSRK